MRHHGFRNLREDNRKFRRDTRRRARIESARGELLGVLMIVLADAKDISSRPRDRRFELDLTEGRRRQAGRERITADNSDHAAFGLGEGKVEPGHFFPPLVDDPDAPFSSNAIGRYLHPASPPYFGPIESRLVQNASLALPSSYASSIRVAEKRMRSRR